MIQMTFFHGTRYEYPALEATSPIYILISPLQPITTWRSWKFFKWVWYPPDTGPRIVCVC